MHSKKEEILVYTIGGVGFLAILFLNLKSGFSMESLLVILKDLAPLMMSFMIFRMLNGFLLRSSDVGKAANNVIEKIRQHYDDIFDKDIKRSEKENAEECLFFAKPLTSFIPLRELRQGILEIRISYGTLANFEAISPRDTAENEKRIEEKKCLVKKKVIENLQIAGAKFKIHDCKDAAVKIEFLPQAKYERILEEVIKETIRLLVSNK